MRKKNVGTDVDEVCRPAQRTDNARGVQITRGNAPMGDQMDFLVGTASPIPTRSGSRCCRRASRPLTARELPTLPREPCAHAVPTTRWTPPRARVGCFRSRCQPSPLFRRVGVHIFTFEACSGFTRVTPARLPVSPDGRHCPAASAIAVRVATESNRRLLGWIFHPLVLYAIVAH